MPHFMVVLISYVNLLNLSWIIKMSILRSMEPLNQVFGQTYLNKQCSQGVQFSYSIITCLDTSPDISPASTKRPLTSLRRCSDVVMTLLPHW